MRVSILADLREQAIVASKPFKNNLLQMKNTFYFRISLALLLMLGFIQANAQSDVSDLIKSSPADATKLAQAYLKPLFKGFGTGLNTGWNNSAHSKNLLRFDLRFGLTGAVVPQKDESFDVTKIGLSGNVRPTNASQVVTPTFAGPSNTGVELGVYDSSNRLLERFSMPEGTGIGLVPAPQLQGSIGLPRGLEFTLRAMPKINLGDDIGAVGMFGGGLKVEVLPLISGVVDKITPIDIAVALGYTQFNYSVPLNVPAPSGASGPSGDFSNQRIEAQFSGINSEVIISKRLLVFTPFLSFGYNTAKTDVGLKGNYPIVTGATLLGQPTYTVFTDPVNIKQTDISGFRTNLGFQLNLAFFRIYGSYSMAEYNAFNAGIGFGLGK
ncbi:DUF6588 family protein [Daejeonella lutea]|uniref:Uncharacterized protein n=1 Tax=Daejeonella lutea TaxID=572036 RepID=A0A1T5A337_9SPHI|nr:DUF6588 family protein [Daejeonella lutea]SKB29147.1 hypothetical protein SAMN05661099_0240 [Daejeonella lutea]